MITYSITFAPASKEVIKLYLLDWPVNSPDMNSIKHVWDIIGRAILEDIPPITHKELIITVEEEWSTIPQELINILIFSMTR